MGKAGQGAAGWKGGGGVPRPADDFYNFYGFFCLFTLFDSLSNCACVLVLTKSMRGRLHSVTWASNDFPV